MHINFYQAYSVLPDSLGASPGAKARSPKSNEPIVMNES